MYIKIWLLKIYCTTGPTRNNTNFVDNPAQVSHLTHPLHSIHFVCKEITEVLQERPTFIFRAKNFAYSTHSECRIWRGNVHLAVSVVKYLTVTVTNCVCC